MLDQNTDRMWFVIGALVVGAGIILLANKALPEAFANVTGTYKNVTDTSILEIKQAFNIDNIITAQDIEIYLSPGQDAKLINFDSESETWTVEIPVQSHKWGRGLRIKQNAVEVPYGTKVITSYDVWLDEGVNGSNYFADINNSYLGETYHGHLNDNDNGDEREYGIVENGQYKVLTSGKIPDAIPLKGGQWTTVWYSYTNNSPENTEKKSIYDYSNLGVTNPYSDKPLTFKIRNVYGYLVDPEE